MLTICRWVARFQRANMSMEDEERLGSPKYVTRQAMIEKIHNVILRDWEVKAKDIPKTVGMSKLSVRCVPCLLNREIDQISIENLELVNLNRVVPESSWLRTTTTPFVVVLRQRRPKRCVGLEKYFGI